MENKPKNKFQRKNVFRTRKEKRKARLEEEKKTGKKIDDRDRNEGKEAYTKRPGYDEIVKENKDFEAYYKAQKIIDNEEEWSKFMDILKQPLPSDFRISTHCLGQIEKLQTFIQDINKLIVKEANVENPEGEIANKLCVTPIPWYPHKLAYTINLSKMEIRKTPILSKLHQFLISEVNTGDISRQEAVSMIPPLLLDIQPGQAILDMCAAPGSKTAQIIEMLHRDSINSMIYPEGKTEKPKMTKMDGLVVANDIDNKRCYMLVHQANRLHSPTCVVINQDAARMAPFYHTDEKGEKSLLKFDRVLADVPCSGDGTIRKNYDVWIKWNQANANNFHIIQLKIAKRGAELLKKGGLISYSTCSLNPLEDEAVIAALLNQAKGGLELIDAAQILPNLKSRPGLEDWLVMSRDNKVYDSYSEVPENLHKQIYESSFPPANVKELNLKYCVRVLPHYQNTGGFFIAVLRKTVDILPWESEPKKDDEGEELKDEKPKQQHRKPKRMWGHKEDPYFFFKSDDVDLAPLRDFFQLNGDCSGFDYRHLADRASIGKRRNIYYLTEKAGNFIASNEHAKIINGGTRAFGRMDVGHPECHFRLTQEGVSTILPYFVHRLDKFEPESFNFEHKFAIIQMGHKDFVELLRQESISCDQFEDKEFAGKLERYNYPGCFIVYTRLKRPTSKDTDFILPVCVFRGGKNLRTYVQRQERMHMLRICGEEPELKVAKRPVDEIGDNAEEAADAATAEDLLQQNEKRSKIEQNEQIQAPEDAEPKVQ